MNAAQQIGYLRAIEHLEEVAARPSADLRWSIDRVASSHHLDRGEVAVLLLAKLVACHHARQAVVAYTDVEA
jgi:hypothetical protein